jgi:hypothetical protein
MAEVLTKASGIGTQAGIRSPRYGEGGIRTRDTTIFSRVLYQLSYLAWETQGWALQGEG